MDIENKKVAIESVFSQKGSNFTVKTTVYIRRLFEKFSFDGAQELYNGKGGLRYLWKWAVGKICEIFF